MYKVLLDSFISALIPAVIILGVVGIIGVTISAFSKTSWWEKHIHSGFPEFYDERCFECHKEGCEDCLLDSQ